MNTPNDGAPTALTVEQAMRLAEQHQAAGRLQQAEMVLRQVLQALPGHAPALHLLGIVAHQAGNTEMGARLLGQAVERQPDAALYHANLGEMHRLLGHLDEAIRHGERAVALDANLAMAHGNLGIAWYDKGDMEKAEACQQRALALQPDHLPSLNNMGSVRRNQKRLDEAEEYYRRALAVAPQYLEAMNNLGAVLTERERPEEAVELLQQALALHPDYADAHHNIGLAWLMLEQEDKALAAFQREMQLRPDAHEPHEGLARLHLGQRNLDEAQRLAARALELAPDKQELHCLMGDIHTQSGFPERAEADYARALELDAELESALLGLGHLRMEQGRMDEAKEQFRRALELHPDSIAARVALAHAVKAAEDDENVQALLREADKLDDMLETKAMSLHFALGKCLDDLKRHDEAFPHFAEGCRLRRKRLEYSAEANARHVDEIIAFFTRERIEQLRGEGCPSPLPIFVLGMPRSGTTLTEQIIASHPDVHGAGELPDLLDLAANPTGVAPSEYPRSLAGITRAELTIMGERYVAGLRERHATAGRITDKMPANFHCIGLIHLMLPNAKIIHVRRNPVDTCLSNFTKLFGHKAQPQSYDLAELGRYYRDYARLMEHWRAVLPADAFYDIQYEELVADTEGQARALIDWCGLEWSDRCLEFHKTRRIVRTASITQVRQPIYTSSVERWRRYEKHLGPLLEALGNLAPR